MSLQEKLHALYLLDSQVRGLRSRLDSAVRRHDAMHNKLKQIEQQKLEVADQIKHEKARATTFEKQADDLEQRITKLRDQMSQVTSNKEYSALLVEVNTLKLEKSQLEESAIGELTQVDELETRLAELVSHGEQQIKLLEGAVAEVKQHQTDVGDRLEQVTNERDAAAAQVPADTLKVFDRLAHTHDGEAVAGVIEENRRRLEYNCDGCYMSIPVERVNALYTRPDEPTTCPNCGRFLYLPEALKSAMGVKD
jgi:predicted  nucleic acid-binding Zn-ribbon protein